MPRNKKNAAAKRKSSTRMTRTESKGRASKKTRPTKLGKTKIPVEAQQTSAGSNRAQGIAMFKLAGRPTREQFQLVYGERGHLMTWEQRAKAGVSAKQFQAALAAKQSGQ